MQQPSGFQALLAAARSGDRGALDKLFERYYPAVRAAAHGAMSLDLRRRRPWLTAMFSTGDVVQEVFCSVLRDVGTFASEHEGAFVKYLSTLVKNRLTDAIRFHEAMRRDPRRMQRSLESLEDDGPSEVDSATLAAATEQVRRFCRALSVFPTRERTLLRERLQSNQTFRALADTLGYPSEDAARKAFHAAQAELLLRLQATDSDA